MRLECVWLEVGILIFAISKVEVKGQERFLMRKTGHERQTVARAAAVVMVVTVLSKLLGFGREAALAAVFGATRVTDAYLVAMVIPGLLFGAVVYALMCRALRVWEMAYALNLLRRLKAHIAR